MGGDVRMTITRGGTLGAAIDRYLTTYAAKRMQPAYYAHTRRSLEHDVKAVLGARPIREITQRDVRELIDGIDRRAPTQARNALAYLRLMLNWAVSNDLIEANPVKGLKLPATPRQRELYTKHNRSAERASPTMRSKTQCFDLVRRRAALCISGSSLKSCRDRITSARHTRAKHNRTSSIASSPTRARFW